MPQLVLLDGRAQDQRDADEAEQHRGNESRVDPRAAEHHRAAEEE